MISSKLCTKCKKDLPVDSFQIRKYPKSTGFVSHCKTCCKEMSRLWKINNPQKYKESRDKSNRRTYQRILNSPELRAKQLKSGREHYHRNLEEQRLRGRLYSANNKEKERERHRRYDNENRDKVNLRNRIYRKNRVKDPIFRLKEAAYSSIRRGIIRSSASKDSLTWKNLPYTPEQLRQHLESLWESWMNWENYGRYKRNGPKTWNIDHIIPQSKLLYDSFDHPNFLKCWVLENLRPLCSQANKEKSNKILC